ncbi:hypothetical protein [Paenibacillus sp. QZ-Y1]|uniref:hypothetical protein n=1 Tax=Paenibacillus sp. QZ-Y1 TaxID=3414511 RepID=UPI003F79ACC2
MKQIFHNPWNIIRLIICIALCQLGFTLLLPLLQAEGTMIPTPSSSVKSLNSARGTTAPQSSLLAPDAVQQFAREQAIALGAAKTGNRWSDASLDYFPLGPGTHGWLVYANLNGNTIGYMIITATDQEDLKLTEYGQGNPEEQLPYSSRLLIESLERHHLNLKAILTAGGGIHLRYAPPLLAYWKVDRPNVEAIYIDATNGDTLPEGVLNKLEADSIDESNNDGRNTAAQVPLSKKVQQVEMIALSTDPMQLKPTFNPADHLLWITSKPAAVKGIQDLFPLWKEHKEVVFSADTHNVLYGGPLPVSGYQIWRNNDGSEQIQYVAIGGHTSVRRFVPLVTLLQEGHFYKTNP